ncbi:MAG: hypothetical protein JJE25_14080 [Bacteroidia bacterium]|nr:hypothetical protein [Bacteroidia bacterium]
MKKLIIITSVLTLAAVAYGFYLYNKPHQSIAKEKAAYSLSAEQLYSQFDSNEEGANKTYLGKVIAVDGRIEQFTRDEKGNMNIYLATGGMNVVSCQMESKSMKQTASLLPGDKVTLKGICTGMLMDIVLVDCVIAENILRSKN